jgi:hypothetical protein
MNAVGAARLVDLLTFLGVGLATSKRILPLGY